MNKYFLVALLLITLRIVSFGQEKPLLRDAQDFYQQSKYAEAIELYKKAIEQKSDEQTLESANYGLGMSYKKLKQYDNAIAAFENALKFTGEKGLFGSRGNLQYEIAKCLLAKRDYQAALTAFRLASKTGFPQMDCTGAHRYERNLYEAICLEHLGRYREALAIYFNLYDSRLIELYDAAGQYDDLKTIINNRDEALIAERMQKYSWQRWKASENLPTRQLNDYFKIYDLEKAGNISALMDLIYKYSKGGRDGRETVVINLLARHPNESLPLVKAALERKDSSADLFYKILGLAATAEAVAILKERTEKSNDVWNALRLIYALSLSGEPGEAVIDELQQKSANENIKIALKKFRGEELPEFISEETQFPKFSFGTKLPTDF